MKKLPRQRPPRNRFDKPDHSVRLGGNAPRIGRQTEFIQWVTSYRKLLNTMKASGRLNRKAPQSANHPGGGPQARVFRQRVAVRVRYSKQKGRGQWKAHGTYIQRESANHAKVGFDGTNQDVPIAEILNQWQKEEDDLFWKIILSPENGKEMNLEEHTRQLMEQMARDLGVSLEWTAAVHRNTEKHHVHIALRGKDRDGKPIVLPSDYVKRGLRERSEALATRELGHRFEADIVHSQRQQITQTRFTDLDRKLLKRRAQDGTVYVNSTDSELKGLRLATELHYEQRLTHLRDMGLAEQLSAHNWRLKPDLERALRAMQQAHDRQKTMGQFGVLASDPKTPFQKTRWRDINKLEGRILVHGQEDNQHLAYMLLEDVNGKIHHLDHRAEIENLRKIGQLQPGSYVAMRVAFTGKEPQWILEDFGSAEQALQDAGFIDRCLRRGVSPPKHNLGGWLGRFRAKIHEIRYASEQPPSPGTPNESHAASAAKPPHEGVFYMPAAAALNRPSQPQAEPFIDTPTRLEKVQKPKRSSAKPERPVISADDAREEFSQALFEAGLVIKGSPIMDGKLHRVAVDNDKLGKKSGVYLGHLDDHPAGYIRNFKSGEALNWRASAATATLSTEERKAFQQRVEQQGAAAERERKQQEAEIAHWAERTWSTAAVAHAHPYLERKRVKAHQLRRDKNNKLLVPMRDVAGKLWSLQRISEDGTKHYTAGGRKQGMHFLLGKVTPNGALAIAEGFATGATIHELTGLPVAIVFDSGNLLSIAKAYREQYPLIQLAFTADNDHHLPRQLSGTGKPKVNVGLAKASEAAREVSGVVVAPCFTEQDAGTDWNDYTAQHGVETAKSVLESALQNSHSLEPIIASPSDDHLSPVQIESLSELEDFLEELRRTGSLGADTNRDSPQKERKNARKQGL